MNCILFFLVGLTGSWNSGSAHLKPASNYHVVAPSSTDVVQQQRDSAIVLTQSVSALQNPVEEKSASTASGSNVREVRGEKHPRYNVKPVMFNSPAMDFSPYPYKNGIVFVSSRLPKNSIQTSEEQFLNLFYTEEQDDGSFSKPELLNKENPTSFHLGPTVFFHDGNQKIVTRNSFYKQAKVKDGTSITLELAQATLSPSGQWSELTPIQFRSAEYSIGHPAISSDGSTLYFSSNMPGSVGGSDIFVSHYENGAWSAPKNLGTAINTSGQELFPYLYNDSILYFASTAHHGLGGLDIFSYNLKLSDAKPNHLDGPINSHGDDFGICFDRNGASGFFSSDRSGSDDIYSFEEATQFVEIQLYDSLTHRYIRNAQLDLSFNDKRVADAISDLMGRAEFRLSSSKVYRLSIFHENYKTSGVELIPAEWPMDQQALIRIYLSPVKFDAASESPTAGLKIRDRKTVTNTISFTSAPLDVDLVPELPESTKEPLVPADSVAAEQVKIVAVENVNALPSVMICLRDSIYDFYAVSETVLQSSLQFQIHIPHGARRSDYEKVITEQVAAQGYHVTRFLLIRSFHFDSEKTLIRNDACAQLDKIIEVMISYPQIDVQLTFHADSRGTDKFNLDLSRRRSEEAVNYLGRAGITKERIISNFVGESQLLNDCGDLSDCDELQHQMNRTAEFKLIVRGQLPQQWYGQH